METVESPPWSPPSIPITEPLPHTLLFFISNFHYLIPIQLNQHNYTIWKLQCQGALKACSLFHYIQETQPPSPTIVDPTGKSIANPVFSTWFVVETHLRSCLIATLTPDVLTQVTHALTAKDLWVLLKNKFGELGSSERFDLYGGSLVICQICGKEGHCALDCSYRFVEDSQARNAAMGCDSYADEVFDGSPKRNNAVSAAIADTVTPSKGMTMLFEPEMWVLNHSDSSYVEDRLALSPEEMIGCQTRQEIVNFEPFQKEPEPLISEVKEKVIVMTQPENDLSEMKREVPTPPIDNASDPSSDSLKKNKMVCFPANCELSAGNNNNDIKLSPKKTGNAVERDDQKIQNSHGNKRRCKSQDDQKIQNCKQGSKSLPVYRRKDDKHVVLVGSTDDQKKIQNSREIQAEGNALQVTSNKQLNSGKKNPTSHEIQVQGNSVQVNRQLNGGKSHDEQKIQNSHDKKREGKSRDDQKIQNCHENKQGAKSLPVYKRKDDKHVVLVGSTDDQKIENSKEIKAEWNALQVDKQLSGGKVIVHVGTSDDQKIQNSSEIQVEGNALQVTPNKQLNSGKKNQTSPDIQVEGKSLQVKGQLNGGKWISWSRPPPGMVALHFDGSLRDGSAAGGGILRDHHGQFLAAFSIHLGPGISNDSNEAEAKALLAGLRFAHGRGIPVHCIYGDSFVVVLAVAGTGVTPWKLSPTIIAIRTLLYGAAIAHTHREGNKVADELAGIGHSLSSGFMKPYLLKEELPAPVRLLLFQDTHDCKTYRPP